MYQSDDSLFKKIIMPNVVFRSFVELVHITLYDSRY